MSNIEKNYNPNEIETNCYQTWENQGHFSSGKTSNDPYVIMLPPPNVTGTLHMGHGFQHTLMDILTRYHRMMGYDTLWQPGTDHAGIATQMVVERKLNAENVHRQDIGREKFLNKVWEWKEQAGGTITKQMRRLGASVDWQREKFTMDEELSQAVKEQFIQLYDEGLIYRGQRLVNWDPVLQTAVSDLEVVNEEANGHLWYFNYPLADGSEHLTIATTRPETLLGDTAVAVNPNDERYQHLIGKLVRLPLIERDIPIIADDHVDMSFGTGCLKITPAHDFNDYEMGKRHHLPLINVLAENATMTNVPEAYLGLDRFNAREKIVNNMDHLGLLVKTETHIHTIPKGDRTGAILEPFLTKQWFVSMQTLAQPAIKAVKQGEVNFIPDNWKNTYFSWLNDIQDWCISRQLWWGHRIPAWYDNQGNVYVAHTEIEARAKYKLKQHIQLTQDEDVFDTWFSSALWPMSTLGWPEQTKALEKYYPSNVLVTGFDIIFFWVARMIMMGIKFMHKAPFKDVYITGLIRDAEGQKMSKSKGNVLDPVDLIDGITLDELIEKRTVGLMQPHMRAQIEKATKKQFPNGIEAYGADALRFTFAALASTSRDICFDTSRMEGYRNFCNKLWNASRFVLMNIGPDEHLSCLTDTKLDLPERWIWHQLNDAITQVHHYIKQYRFDLIAQTIYEFIWNEYCNWYVELSKCALNSDHVSDQYKQTIKFTLTSVLDSILRLSHPIIPFITEALYKYVTTALGMDNTTIMTQQFPLEDQELVDQEAMHYITWLKEIIVAIRTMRAEINIKPGMKVSLIIKNATIQDQQQFDSAKTILHQMAKVDHLTFLEDNKETPASATSIVNHLELHIPLAGLIDVQAEILRISKEIGKIDKDLNKILNKLNNPKFLENAPDEIVTKEKNKATSSQTHKDKLEHQLNKLRQIQ